MSSAISLHHSARGPDVDSGPVLTSDHVGKGFLPICLPEDEQRNFTKREVIGTYESCVGLPDLFCAAVTDSKESLNRVWQPVFDVVTRLCGQPGERDGTDSIGFKSTGFESIRLLAWICLPSV